MAPIADKVVLITGGTGGVGKATAATGVDIGDVTGRRIVLDGRIMRAGRPARL